MTRKDIIKYTESKRSEVHIKEEKVGRIVSAESLKQLTECIRPRICRARQIKMVAKPIRMDARPILVNISGVRAATKRETPPTFKVEFEDRRKYFAQLEHSKEKCIMGGVHYVGKEVTLTGFQKQILLSPTFWNVSYWE